MSEQRIVVEARRIWWCEAHNTSGSDYGCRFGREDDCRMMESGLAPLAALIINREELPDMERLREAFVIWDTHPLSPDAPSADEAHDAALIVEAAARWVLSLESE